MTKSPTRNLFLLALCAFALSLVATLPVFGTEYYALRVAGSDCTLCHTDPRVGHLNLKGIAFRESGYRYPFTFRGVFFLFLGFALFPWVLWGLWRRCYLWGQGKGKMAWKPFRERMKGVLFYGLGHRKILDSLFPGVSHLLLFAGFFSLSLSLCAFMAQEYLYLPLTGERFFNASSYPYVRLFLDVSGGLGVTGTLLLAGRRYVQKPKGLDDQPRDRLTLVLLFLVFLTGLMTTGVRNHFYDSPYSSWSPVATFAGSLWTALIGKTKDMKTVLGILWWAHYLLSMTLLGYIPFSGLLHLFASPLSIFFRNLEPKGCLSRMDLDALETFGVGRMEDFTKKDLLELDSCTRCGRCQEQCPAYLSGKALNPKRVVQKLRCHMGRSPLERKKLSLLADVVSQEEIWQCTTCRNCLEHCPVFIEPMIKLLELRRHLVLNLGRIPKETRFAFRNIERHGNPWGFEASKRMGWTKTLGVREIGHGEKVDLLYWVGCYGSFDDRNISIATALVKLLRQAGLRVGVLGQREGCCGIDLRRMGNEYLYELTAERNIAELQAVKFREIVTACPHCYNTLKNEYPQFGGRFEVIHHTTLLERLIEEQKIPLDLPKGKKNGLTYVTYHDSCYLGRYNDLFDPPRRILASLRDIHLVEMERHRERSFCCGGGGCHMWMEEKAGRRINEMRVEMAQRTGADVLATACPLCTVSLDSALRVLNLEEKLHVKDIAELVWERSEHLAQTPRSPGPETSLSIS